MARKNEKDTGLDRRSFLKISSAAAVTAAVAGPVAAAAVEETQAVKPGKSAKKPDLKGKWFAV